MPMLYYPDIGFFYQVHIALILQLAESLLNQMMQDKRQMEEYRVWLSTYPTQSQTHYSRS